jgi:hypothetical protein
MQGIPLSAYFPQRKYCVYSYDFGDDWTHHITLTGVIEDFDGDVPELLEGQGDAPPEDVGGSGGFEEFLRVIGDPSDPEHEEMLAWAKGQHWSPFDFEQAVRELRWRSR